MDILIAFMYGMVFKIDAGIYYLMSKKVDYTEAKDIVTGGTMTTLGIMSGCLIYMVGV